MFQVKPDDKKETETSKENKLSFLDNIKSIRILPSFLSKKQSKVKDVEAGVDKEEESKELLEKKEGKNFRDNFGDYIWGQFWEQFLGQFGGQRGWRGHTGSRPS